MVTLSGLAPAPLPVTCVPGWCYPSANLSGGTTTVKAEPGEFGYSIPYATANVIVSVSCVVSGHPCTLP
jgi:hypothetical protein